MNKQTAPEWISLQEASDLWDEAMANNPSHGATIDAETTARTQDEINRFDGKKEERDAFASRLVTRVRNEVEGIYMGRAFTMALAAKRFVAHGIRHDGTMVPRVLGRDEIPTEYFAIDTRAFRHGRIEAASDDQSQERFLHARDFRIANPDWRDVLFHGPAFREWLDSCFSYDGGVDRTVPLAQLTEAEATKIYKEYVKKYPANKPPPSRKDDHKYMSARGYISQKAVRSLRSLHAPDSWKEGGVNKRHRATPSPKR